MAIKPIKVVHFIILAVVVFLNACQGNNQLPVVPNQQTIPAQTQTPQNTSDLEKNQPTHTPTAEPTATLLPHLSVDPSQLRGTEIIFWHPWSGNTAAKATQLIDEFNRSNEWGIKVHVQGQNSAGVLFDTVEYGLTQDPVVLPRIVAAPADQLSTFFKQKGIVVGLDDYITHAKVGLSEQEAQAFHSGYWQQDRANDQQLGLPILRTANVLFYNQTWARELGFDIPPTTPAEFKEQACAAAVKNNGAKILEKYGTGGWLVDTDPLTTLSWMSAFGALPQPTKEGQGYTCESEEAENAIGFLRDLLDNGCAWLGRSQSPDQYFAKRMALFYSASLQDLYVQKRINDVLQNSDEWLALPYPTEDHSGIVYSNGYSLAIFQQPNQDETNNNREQMAAWLFIRWMSQPANQVRLAEPLPSLPVSSSVETLMLPNKDNFPWRVFLHIAKYAQPAPGDSSWRTVRRLVQDAGYQVFHLPSEQVPSILPQLDSIIKEMENQQ